jgi:uncharacterized protein (TIGR03435 family)
LELLNGLTLKTKSLVRAGREDLRKKNTTALYIIYLKKHKIIYGEEFMQFLKKIATSIFIVLFMNFFVFSQDENTQLDSIDNTPIVFLKAEMSPSKPDLKRSYMRNCHEGEYKDRRFTAEGVVGKTLLIGAFKITGDKLIDKVGLTGKKYSVDVIVPRGMEHMLPGLVKNTVTAGLGVSAKWETIETQVGVLKRLNNRPLKLTKSEAPRTTFSYDESNIKCSNTTLQGFARLLSSTSIGMPVIDETKTEGEYDFDIEWDAGNIESLNDVLNQLGLETNIEVRPMKLVVVRAADK